MKKYKKHKKSKHDVFLMQGTISQGKITEGPRYVSNYAFIDLLFMFCIAPEEAGDKQM
jgi:hypothetical protein